MPSAAVQRQSAKRVVKLCGLIGRRRSLQYDEIDRMDDLRKKRFEWLKELERIVLEPVKVDFRVRYNRSDMADALAYWCLENFNERSARENQTILG